MSNIGDIFCDGDRDKITYNVVSVISNIFKDKDKVVPVPGSIVYCDLLAVEHSGVYIGNNKIVHLDGSGKIECVSPDEFLNRLDGFNTAISIYVSSRGKKAVGNQKISNRAKNMIGNKRNYNFILDNCHQFTAGCITGDFENSNNLLLLLKYTVEKKLGVDTWRVWDR